MQNAELWCARCALFSNHFRRKYKNFAFCILHSAFRTSADKQQFTDQLTNCGGCSSGHPFVEKHRSFCYDKSRMEGSHAGKRRPPAAEKKSKRATAQHIRPDGSGSCSACHKSAVSSGSKLLHNLEHS